MRNSADLLRHIVDRDACAALGAHKQHLIADLRVKARTCAAAAHIDLEHTLIHADITHLIAKLAVVNDLGAARKCAIVPVGVANGQCANFHAAGGAVMQAVAHAFAHGRLAHVRDARVHAHGRAQVEIAHRFGARVETIQGDAEASHIEMRIGVAQKRCGIRAVHDARVYARHAHVGDSLGETAELHVEIERFRAVGRGEVGERAHVFKRAMEADLAHELNRFVEAHANAIHARVERQMERGAQPVGVGRLTIGDGEFGRIHARHDVVVQKQRNSRLGRLRKHEHRRGNARLAQLHAFLHRCHRKVGGAGRKCGFRNLDRTMPVGVGLHNGQQAAPRLQATLGHSDIVANGAQIDLDP